MSQVLDLNNLVPDGVQIKVGDTTLEMKPPTMRSLFMITKLAEQIDATATTPEEIDTLRDKLYAEMCLLVPGLDQHELNDSQLLALAGLVASVAQPDKEEKETTDQGGKVTPDPKAPTA